MGKDLKSELQIDVKPQVNGNPSVSRGIQQSQGCPKEITLACPSAPRQGSWKTKVGQRSYKNWKLSGQIVTTGKHTLSPFQDLTRVEYCSREEVVTRRVVHASGAVQRERLR